MKYDIDVSKLSPGSVIEQSVCEQVIGFTRESDMYQYSFQVMQLADYVKRLLWKEGNRWTVATRDGAIVVLTHEQASKYNSSRFNNAIAKMRRCNKQLVAVDISELPVDMRKEHDERIAKQSRILQGMRQRKEIDLSPSRRTIPLGA